MNIFNAFTFGSLIKTFIPGFVWLIALSVLEAHISKTFSGQPNIWQFTASHEQTALVLAIPAAILLGLLSNIAVFMGLNDWLVRNPVRKKCTDLFDLYDFLVIMFRSKCLDALHLNEDSIKSKFDKYVDVEILLLQNIDLEQLVYIREQYWYHLEFQVNLFISSITLFFVLFLCSTLDTPSLVSILKWLSVYGVAAILSYALLIPAAKKNFQRHISKISSVIAAAIGPKAT